MPLTTFWAIFKGKNVLFWNFYVFKEHFGRFLRAKISLKRFLRAENAFKAFAKKKKKTRNCADCQTPILLRAQSSDPNG